MNPWNVSRGRTRLAPEGLQRAGVGMEGRGQRNQVEEMTMSPSSREVKSRKSQAKARLDKRGAGQLGQAGGTSSEPVFVEA